MRILSILLVVCGVHFYEIECIAFKTCGYFKITELKIDGCKNEPCEFKHNQTMTAHITFNSTSFDIDEKLEKNVYVYMKANVPLEEIHPDDPCVSIKCPIPKNYVTTYKTSFKMKQVSPVNSGIFHFELRSVNRKDTLLCLETNVILQK